MRFVCDFGPLSRFGTTSTSKHDFLAWMHNSACAYIYIYMELLIRKCCYFALCEPMVWQYVIGKDLFEGFVKSCGEKKKLILY